MLLAAESGQFSAVCLLDLTAAFDTINHDLLMRQFVIAVSFSSRLVICLTGPSEFFLAVSEVAGRQHLRSARCHQQCQFREFAATPFGSSAFSVVGPRVWNSLPEHLRDPAVDPEQFRRDPKMYLFTGHSKR